MVFEQCKGDYGEKKSILYYKLRIKAKATMTMKKIKKIGNYARKR